MNKIALLLAVLTSTLTLAAPADFPLKDIDGCYPKGSLRPESFGFAASGMNEETFNKVLDRVEKVYQPIFQSEGLQLDIVRLWDNPQANAAAMPHPQKPEQRGIFMFGGLARHPEMTADGFTLVACHEIGHHIGGAPTVFKKTWVASDEGQSDYFATLKCARRVFAQDDNVALMKNVTPSALAKEKCGSSFKTEAEIAICLRTSVASQALANVAKALTQEAINQRFPGKGMKVKDPKLETPDPSEVAQTNHDHPGPQCRLDTMFQGATCHVGIDQYMNAMDPEAGSCVRRLGDRDGVRPLCWYAPNSQQAPPEEEIFLIEPEVIIITDIF